MKISCIIFISCLILITGASFGQIKTAGGQEISFAQMDLFIHQQMDSLKLPGTSVAIINKGKIIYERQFGYANVDSLKKIDQYTIFEAASLSKAVFGYFVLKLRQDGKLKLDLNQPVYQYFSYPDIAYDERNKLVTANMLLSHTSGLPNWREHNKLEFKLTPGVQYSYSGEGFEYLAKAVEYLTHTTPNTLDSLFQKEVSIPLGLQHFGYIGNTYLAQHKAYGYYSNSNNSKGQLRPVPNYFGAAHTLHTNAHDYAMFLTAIMKGKGLTKNNVDSLLQPRVQTRFPDNSLQNVFYAYGFAVEKTPFGTRYMHTGNNGNFTGGFMFFRDKQLGYVVLTNGDHGIELDAKLAQLLTFGFSNQ
ncbi:serine hydrolase domain-containing protein [Emticicia sp. 17c]|uniref:serine hydrolase domain-containing protein n=1 Tax=Emticicia sp. 17c TaxID=3127704 RepID=UPI00301C26CE